jgi:hypothetical protein
MSARPRRTTPERRDTPRVAATLEAMIKSEQRPFQLFHTRDLSLDGAFVEIGPHRLAHEDKVDVALKIPNDGVTHIYRFGARITRVSPIGVGMVFDHVNTESYAALLDFMFSKQPRGNV